MNPLKLQAVLCLCEYLFFPLAVSRFSQSSVIHKKFERNYLIVIESKIKILRTFYILTSISDTFLRRECLHASTQIKIAGTLSL